LRIGLVMRVDPRKGSIVNGQWSMVADKLGDAQSGAPRLPYH
jgi:hypothetical protein